LPAASAQFVEHLDSGRLDVVRDESIEMRLEGSWLIGCRRVDAVELRQTLGHYGQTFGPSRHDQARVGLLAECPGAEEEWRWDDFAKPTPVRERIDLHRCEWLRRSRSGSHSSKEDAP
jgi:hypothetical protein